MSSSIGIRRSITDIQKDYDKGNKTALDTLMRAWKGIKELPPHDANSFFCIGGFHGEPFRDQGATDPQWWGGYCQHGTVLFPSWHRAYLCRLEKALQSIPGCADVTLPFWDECSDDARENGIPTALTQETFVLDGQTIPNPLRSFVLPVSIVDDVKGDPIRYSKPMGYETVRYPLSGLVGTPADAVATETHNAQFPDPKKNTSLLNDNISTWLSGKIKIDGNWMGEVYSRFVHCLDAPSYTLFSNTTSAKAWNQAHGTKLVPLEAPHNYMHLAVGGFDYPGQGDFSAIPGANGDMGENDTAGLDPIFFFHHCFIDYTFWVWQQRHGATKSLDIDPADPGAKYSQDAPPPADADKDAPLTLSTALAPFTKPDGVTPITTADCVDIEGQLGYTYGPGSLDAYAHAATVESLVATKVTPKGGTVRVSGISRSKVRGSFLISAFATVDGQRQYVGTEAILSRWHVEGCMNCMNHLEATASFRLPLQADGTWPIASGIEVEVRTRDSLVGGQARRPAAAVAAEASPQPAPFKVDVI
jgi:tyrosinase